MARWIFARLGAMALMMTLAAWSAATAVAKWQLHTTTRSSIAFNQGITFDQARGKFFFDGVSSTTTSGVYRTNSHLLVQAARIFAIPKTVEGYNHAGDLSFDAGTQSLSARRVLLPLECYYPSSGGNTCGSGAIGIVDPTTLRFRYYVNLDRSQIQKAMWAEISPDGRWIWTSSGTHLLVYRAADVNPTTAARQRAGTLGGITGKDLGSVLPTSGVTGAAFYQDAFARAPRLLLALNQGTYSEVISYATGNARDGSPTLAGSSKSEITVAQSPLDQRIRRTHRDGRGPVAEPARRRARLADPSGSCADELLQPDPQLPPGAGAAARQRERPARPAAFHRTQRPQTDGGLQPPLHQHRDGNDSRTAGATPGTGISNGTAEVICRWDGHATGRQWSPHTEDLVPMASSHRARWVARRQARSRGALDRSILSAFSDLQAVSHVEPLIRGKRQGSRRETKSAGHRPRRGPTRGMR